MTSPAPLKYDITVDAAIDFIMTINFIDQNTSVPVNLSTPKMEIRQKRSSTSTLIVAPTMSVTGNVVTATVTSAVSKNLPTQEGFYDVFATRVDNGQVVKLAEGKAHIVTNVTA